jgi:hypothetical protein
MYGFSVKKTRPDMSPIQRAAVVFGLSVLGLSNTGSEVRGQAVAFIPIPAPAFNGQTVTVTPAVSADRRYVRLTVNPYFNAINGFTTFSTQLGAVGGGGGGAFNAGMNGVIGQQGLDGGGAVDPFGYVSQPGQMRAGPMPVGGFGGDDLLLMAQGMNGGAAVGWDGWPEAGLMPTQDWPHDEAVPAAARPDRSVKSTTKIGSSHRRSVRKSPPQRATKSSSRQRDR